MDFFGIGGSELLLLVFLGGVILGPRRLVQLARDLRRVIAQVRGLTSNLTEQLNREINLLEADEAPAARPKPSEAAAPPPGAAAAQPGAAAVPEAYRRFREDFPEEGRLADRAGADGARNGQADRAARPGQLPGGGPSAAQKAPAAPAPPPGRPN